MENFKIATLLLRAERLNEITAESIELQNLLNNKNMKLKEETINIIKSRLSDLENEMDNLKRYFQNNKTENIKITVTLTDVDEDFKWAIYRLFNQLHCEEPQRFNYETNLYDCEENDE